MLTMADKWRATAMTPRKVCGCPVCTDVRVCVFVCAWCMRVRDSSRMWAESFVEL